MTNTKYSISAASRIISKSRATVSRHMASGKLSFELDNDGNKTIEASELVRVYGDDCKFDREERRGQTTETKRSETEPDDTVAAMQAVQQQLIQQYESQIEHLKETLKTAQEGQNSVTKLLEDRSSETNAWEVSLNAMSEKIANQTETQIKTLQTHHDREVYKLKRALHKERKKSLWKKVFG